LFQAIAEKFLEGDLEIDSFLEQFIARRKLTHLRRVKADKMAEILTRQRNAPRQLPVSSPSQGHTHHAAASYMPLPPITGSMPYPTTGMYMPMPGTCGPVFQAP
jgi:ESCRT-I complex subunit VPS37